MFIDDSQISDNTHVNLPVHPETEYGPEDEHAVATAVPIYPVSHETDTINDDCKRDDSLLKTYPAVEGLVQIGIAVHPLTE